VVCFLLDVIIPTFDWSTGSPPVSVVSYFKLIPQLATLEQLFQKKYSKPKLVLRVE